MIKWLKNALFPEYEEPQRVEIQSIAERFPPTREYQIKRELDKMREFMEKNAPGILQAMLINRAPKVMGSYEQSTLARDAVELAEMLRKQIDKAVLDEKQELERIFEEDEKRKVRREIFDRNVGDYKE